MTETPERKAALDALRWHLFDTLGYVFGWDTASSPRVFRLITAWLDRVTHERILEERWFDGVENDTENYGYRVYRQSARKLHYTPQG